MSGKSKRIHLKIRGDVQGVNFRWYAQKQAQNLGLVGWVKNSNDSAVEIEAEGEEEKLKEFLNWCKTGPRWARVDCIEEKWEDIGGGSLGEFEIRY